MNYSKLFKIVLGLCCVAAGVLFILARGRSQDGVTIRPSGEQQSLTDAREDAAGSHDSEASGESVTAGVPVAVHVCGEVVQPGVYGLPQGSRIGDAIEAAGGFSDEADRDYLNLALPVEDGMQIRVPSREESESLRRSQAAALSALVDINSAGEDELMTLPGIGSARAQAIISYREANGPFGEISDIMQVSGIKEAAFEKIKDRIRTGG